MGMGIGMVHHFMPGVMKSLDRFGIFVDPFSYDKKGGGDLITIQNGNELFRILITPSGIERKGADFILFLDAVNRELARGCGSSHKGRVIDESQNHTGG